MKSYIKYLLFLLSAIFFISCKKDNEPEIPTSPKLGTTWTYIYKTFDGGGSLMTTSTVKYKATSELTFAGEKWLKITDSLNNTFFILKLMPDGLYQYANDTARLLCKAPAVVNQLYTSYNNGGTENFTVKEVGASLYVPNGTLIVNRYEGEKSGHIVDVIWYEKDKWLVKMEKNVPNFFDTTIYHRDKRWELSSIDY